MLRTIIIILGVGLVGLAGVLFFQSSVLTKYLSTKSDIVMPAYPLTQPSATPSAGAEGGTVATKEALPFGAQLLKSFTQEWDTVDYRVAQYCVGTVKTFTSEKSGKVCVGENYLTLEYGDTITVIDTRTSQDYLNAPILMSAGLPSSVGGPYLVIEYAPNSCWVDETQCGAGMPEHHATFVADLMTKNIRALKNYPQSGKLDFEEGGRYAILVVPTCGGAGCEVAPIRGYDVVKDEGTDLTTEKAASEARAKSPSGEALPWWDRAGWVGEGKASATIVQPSGARNTIQIDYPAN